MNKKTASVVGHFHKSRNCPSCQNWWFNRMHHGCKIDDKRSTNTTHELGSQYSAGPCSDFVSK